MNKKYKLTVEYDWETLFWYFDGIKVIHPEIAFEKVEIDGIEYHLEWKWKSVKYDDHGHTYSSESWHAFVLEHGVLGARISLAKILDRKKPKHKIYAIVEDTSNVQVFSGGRVGATATGVCA